MVAAPGDHSIQCLLNFNSDDEEDPQDPEVYYQIPESLEEPHPFNFDPPDIQRVNNIRTENSYIEHQYNNADLILSNLAACVKAFNKDGLLGLLYLFLPSRFIDKYTLGATQESLNEKEPSRGKKIMLTVNKIRCVIGLDIAMSLCNAITMKELWSCKMFLGSPLFAQCMSRDEFVAIRGSLQIHSKTCSKNHLDPLWSCPPLFSQVFRNFATVAFPVGVAFLDKASCQSKSRNRGKTYCPNKPDKFAFRFYSLNGWKYVYTFVIWDNGTGNSTPNSSADRFLSMFGELILAYNHFSTQVGSKIRDACAIPANNTSMLWVLMFGLLFRQIYANRLANTTAKQDPKKAVSQMTEDSDDEAVATYALDVSTEAAKHIEDGGDAKVVSENDNVADTASDPQG